MRETTKEFFEDMKNFQNQNEYVAMLCGSSLCEPNPNDTDIFIYSLEDEEVFANRLYLFLKAIDTDIKLKYYENLKFYSVKYKSVDFQYSLHIVSIKTLKEMIEKTSQISTYTDINIFEVDLYMQTVYRKWVRETEFICGNECMLANIKTLLSKKEYDVNSNEVINVLRKRIINNVAYYKEKYTHDKITANIIILQIINNLINYCYFVNKIYYGTVKYIYSDLISFKTQPPISKITLDLFQSINVKSEKEFIAILDSLLIELGD